jgi:DNA polymerase kappa
VTYT